VDVNVHPTKAEVRFRDSGRLHGLVLGAVRERLLGSDLAPRAAPRRDAETVLRNVEPVPDRQTLQQQLADFFRAPPTTQLHLDLSSAPATTSASTVSPSPFRPDVSSASFTLPPSQATLDASATPPVAAEPPPTPAPASSFDRPTNAIQLHNSYLVAETDDGLVIIDQHALHERIMFERLLAQVTRGPLESQRLLLPLTVPASPQQVELLDSLQPLLARLGIEASAFGPSAVAIQAFPSFLEKLDPVAFMRDLLDRAEQNLLTLNEEAMLHEVLDMMSCKAAVKAGDPLTPSEIDALLAQRHLIDRSSNCPHGRPTTLRLSLRDLEKQFKRTGF
jgi:DNA mismatch repair protein MutL